MSIGRYKAVIVQCYALPNCGILLVSLSYNIHDKTELYENRYQHYNTYGTRGRSQWLTDN